MMLEAGKDGRDANGTSHASRPARPVRDQFICKAQYWLNRLKSRPKCKYIKISIYRVPIRDIISSLASWSSTLSDCVTFRAHQVRAQQSPWITHTTLSTDFLEDSCSSPAMINSSRI
jgi:hypothetical protein